MLKFKDYSEEEILEAVKQNGLALQFVKNQTEAICLAAVKEYGYALNYIKKQTEEICYEAVKKDGNALKYVEAFYPSLLKLASVYMDDYKEHFKDRIKKEMTIKEIEKELGYEIKIIKESE